MSNLTINTRDQFEFTFSKEAEKEIILILKKYPPERKASAVMPLLDLAQREAGGWLPITALEAVAQKVGLAYMRVLEIASFYTMYNLNPVGKWHLQLCGTTPCWLRGSDDILKAIYDTLQIKPNETCKNGDFTLTPVECLGACVNAPMMQINDEYFEDLDKEKTLEILDKILNGETPKPGSYRGRVNNEPENNRKTLLDVKNA